MGYNIIKSFQEKRLLVEWNYAQLAHGLHSIVPYTEHIISSLYYSILLGGHEDLTSLDLSIVFHMNKISLRVHTYN